jgi:hypothetical protein
MPWLSRPPKMTNGSRRADQRKDQPLAAKGRVSDRLRQLHPLGRLSANGQMQPFG